MDLAGFTTNYTNLQVQTPIRPGVLDISNAAAATIRGFEAEIVGRLSKTVTTGGHLAWLDTRYDEYIAVGAGGVTGDVAGNRLSNAPQWSGRTWFEWNPRVSANYTVSFRADARWQTTVFFTPFNDSVQRQNPYGLLDVSALIGPRRGRWSVSVYSRNLTNQDYITGSISTPPPAIGGRPGEPRQIAVQLTVRR